MESEADEKLSNGYKTEWQKAKEHKEKILKLGYRIQVLRVLVKNRFIDKRDSMAEKAFWDLVEKHIDKALIKLNYDLELAIDFYRELVPKKDDIYYGICKCGCVPPFCGCEGP